jgi:hypothetical protein
LSYSPKIDFDRPDAPSTNMSNEESKIDTFSIFFLHCSLAELINVRVEFRLESVDAATGKLR